MNLVPVILCGGGGTRLWPLSRDLFPKQFLSLFADDNSLLQTTLQRLQGIQMIDPYIICNENHRFIVEEQIREEYENSKIILEPCGRNTAPAVAAVALHIQKILGDAIMVVLPADHKIDDVTAFQEALIRAQHLANDNYLVTFGVKPNKPETGYGYIETGAALADGYQVKRFVEKPSLAKAQEYVSSGQFYWNSGMFVFKASQFLAELQQFAPDIFAACQTAITQSNVTKHSISLAKEAFNQCRAESIDYGVMEHTQRAVMIPLQADWNDVGSWSSLWETQELDKNGNSLQGDVIAENVSNSLLLSKNRLLVCLGMNDCIAVETADAVLIANKNDSQAVKDVVQHLKEQKREEATSHRKVYRPWGSYETLVESANYKVKHIIVNPHASLSLQLHQHRAEHWTVIQGTAEVTCGEKVFLLEHDQSTYIPQQTKHRLHNPHGEILEIIEVQTGSYVGEDDIVRFEDVYGRVKEAIT